MVHIILMMMNIVCTLQISSSGIGILQKESLCMCVCVCVGGGGGGGRLSPKDSNYEFSSLD